MYGTVIWVLIKYLKIRKDKNLAKIKLSENTCPIFIDEGACNGQKNSVKIIDICQKSDVLEIDIGKIDGGKRASGK